MGAISSARCEGSTSSRLTSRPSAREMTLWAMTKVSPSGGGSSRRCTTRAARSSPGWMAGSPVMGMRRTSDGMRCSEPLQGCKILGRVDVEGERLAFHDGDAQRTFLSFQLVTTGAGAAEAEGNGFGRAQEEGVGAAVLGGGDDDVGPIGPLEELGEILGSGQRQIGKDHQEGVGLRAQGPGAAEVEGAVQAALAFLEGGGPALAGQV